MPRIALIHALSHSVAPINRAFEQSWPKAALMNLLDDSLSADLAHAGGVLDASMHQRFLALGDYAVSTGADAILFTCSAFGSCIDKVIARHRGIPVLKPNQAMVNEAVASGKRIGLLASFAPTLLSMPSEFPLQAQPMTALAEGALDALNRGDLTGHDEAAALAALHLQSLGCEVIALAQFSLARAAAAVRAATGLPVLTTVDSAVAELRRLLE
jgi:aspartate/glutamate racemase